MSRVRVRTERQRGLPLTLARRDYIALPAGGRKTPQQPAAACGCQGTHGRAERPASLPSRTAGCLAGELALLATRRHTARQ